MAGLLDFLQAASNAAASNVSGPVDGINWLLKKVGVPVSDAPVGGSQWMQNKGLTRPVQQGAAQVAGETVGLLSPFMAAQYAPQIAKGLLQAGQNMAAPATLNPQKGAIVWHGSPHKFDRFDSSKIGTGEGAQAYGHGIYTAESPDVAQSYQALGHMQGNVGRVGKVPIDEYYNQVQNTANRLPPKQAQSYYDRMALLEDLMLNKYPPEVIANARANGYSEETIGWLTKQVLPKYEPAGNLYKVDLPDTAIAKMLDWDKPLSQQAPEVQKALDQIATLGSRQAEAVDIWRSARPGTMGDSGDFFYRGLAPTKRGASQEASQMLRSAGIPGIRYLDGGSRGAGAGTSNYVVFPGEEGLLSILERNGMPLR